MKWCVSRLPAHSCVSHSTYLVVAGGLDVMRGIQHKVEQSIEAGHKQIPLSKSDYTITVRTSTLSRLAATTLQYFQKQSPQTPVIYNTTQEQNSLQVML